jgi:glycosyltransferase involved in cell wall biosynthesis
MANNIVNDDYINKLKNYFDGVKVLNPQTITLNSKYVENLKITYVIGNLNIYEENKILINQINKLSEIGTRVTALIVGEKPEWFKINGECKIVDSIEKVNNNIGPCDLIVACSWWVIWECVKSNTSAVVFFEQGGRHLFQFEELSDDIKATITKMIRLCNFVITPSGDILKIYNTLFGIKPKVFNSGINDEIYNTNGKINSKKSILIIGNEKSKYKRFDDVINIHKSLNSSNNQFELVWVTSEKPNNPYGKVVINPSDIELANIYRESFVYVNASENENFSIDTLQAMACGCPVVSTKNIGINEFCIDHRNCLLSPVGDVKKIENNILEIASNSELKQKIISRGIITSNRFKIDKTVPRLLKYFREVARYKPVQ